MPVYKYRRVEDMPPARGLKPGDPAIGRRMRYVCRLASALAGSVDMPRGVRKYRSIEEMNADRDRWEQERIDRLRRERAQK